MDEIREVDKKIIGLTGSEVEQRIAQGLTNKINTNTDKTTAEIVLSNVCTYFNLIFLKSQLKINIQQPKY